MPQISFKIYTLGCKVNQYDSGRLEKILSQSGFLASKGKASLAIINTCAVTKSAITKDRRMIALAKKENPTARIIIIGCWPKAYEVQEDVFLISSLKGPEAVAKEIIKQVGGAKKCNHEKLLLSSNADRSRYFIKIQDGCEQFCSYCIIPYTRGPLKSRSTKEIRQEVAEAVSAGYQEIVLSGIHLGLYGREKKGQESLVALLKKLLSIKGLGRLRLSSIEINEVSDELIALFKKERQLCRHLHISLQSGSDKVLKAMNRPYSAKYFKERVDKIRRALPEIAISTDVIVGFPRESEADFLKTYNFCKELAFSKIHVFSFSAHEKTPAYNLEPKVSPQIIKERSKKLRALSLELEKNYKQRILKSWQGKEVDLLLEEKKKDKARLKSEFYFDLLLSHKSLPRGAKIGQIVKIKAFF